MRRFAVLMTVLASAGALAPVAANAAPGTSMYQPGPVIVHTQAARDTHASATRNERYAQGRAVYQQQIQSIRSHRAG